MRSICSDNFTPESTDGILIFGLAEVFGSRTIPRKRMRSAGASGVREYGRFTTIQEYGRLDETLGLGLRDTQRVTVRAISV